mgnify:CR=1 FL=1
MKNSVKFPKPLVLKKIGDMLWELYEDFWYWVGDISDNDLIIVPSSTQTDLASIPRFFWIIYPVDGRWTYAAIPHDYLYHTQVRTRKEADYIFLEALKEIGVGFFTRRIFYSAVRVFGWMPWNAQTKRLKNHVA